jgi:acetate---CoA ligase (ADP-forming)
VTSVSLWERAGVRAASQPDRLRRMDALLRPRSVAVVGASPNPSFVSMALRNLLRYGYTGQVVAINPRYEHVEGAPCYPSLRDVPHPVDLVVVGVAAQRIPQLLEECEQKQVGALDIITSGFAETGPEGAQRQALLTAWAEHTGIVVGGPNCLGLMHVPSGMIALPTSFGKPLAGSVGVVLQSGMMAPTVLFPLFARGIGVTFAVTSGNEADVEAADYIRYFVDDEETRVIGCFAEQIKTPSRFIDACEAAAERGKPIVMLKIGRSAAARRAALAHTGSMVGSDDVIDAVLRKLGVSRVNDVDEMLEQLAVFHSPRLPRGSGVAAITVSGGAAGLLSDLAPDCGINFVPLPASTEQALREVVPEFGNVGNPLDVTGQAVFQTDILARSLDLLAGAPGVDVVVYGRSHPARLDRAAPVGRTLEAAHERHPDTVFLSIALVGGHYYPGQSPDLPLAEPVDRLNGTPFLQGSEYGLRAAAALIRYSEFLRSRPAERPRRLAEPQLIAPGPPLSERASKAILARYGIPTTRERLCSTLEEAAVAARDIGYPVALKLEAPGLVHKTDVGGVLLGIDDEAALRKAWQRLQALNVPDAAGVLVQEMAPPGVEVLLGMTRDEQFGPVIAVGLGGIFVEVLEDVQLLVPPITAREAREALQRLRGIQLLHGARGRPPADLEALVATMLRFSELCLDVRDAVEAIDINPLIVLPHGVRAIDALVVPVDALVVSKEGEAAHGLA